MDINARTLADLFTGFNVLFNKSIAETTTNWEKIATLVPSETGEEVYPWLSALPRMREWIGDRVIKKLATEGYSIKNKSYESTIAIPKDSISDDRFGVYKPVVQMMSEEAATFPDSLVFQLLKDGFSKNCFDGKPFFAADHPGKGKSTLSNKGVSVLSMESYGVARAAIMSMVDDEGKPLKIIPNLLLVPPALEGMALKITKSERIGNEDNPYRGTAEALVIPELAGADTAWYLMSTTKAIKPIIYQQRKKPEITQRIDPTSDAVFSKGQYEYGIEARGNAGYSLWQLAYGSTGAGV